MKQFKWLLGLVFHNFWWKLLSLASALLIWALVASEPELSTFTTVPVEYRNLPAELEISSTPMESVSLELRGPAGELPGVGSNRRPAVVIDMSNVSPGRTTFTIGDGNVITPRGVRLVRAIPSEVQFDFEHRLTRTVPVQAQLTGQAAQGYRVLLASVSPSAVTITGPASHVAQVRAATTDPINLSTVAGNTQFHVNAFVDDPYVRMRTAPRVTVAVTMKKK